MTEPTPGPAAPVRPDTTRTLRDAAVKLRELATDAERELDTNPYWRSQLVDRPGWYANGVRNGLGGPSGELAAAMHPGVGTALAELLDVEADAVDDMARQAPDLTDEQLAGLTHGLLTVARALLGEVTG